MTYGNHTGEFLSIRTNDPCVAATPNYLSTQLTVVFAVRPGCREGEEGTVEFSQSHTTSFNKFLIQNVIR